MEDKDSKIRELQELQLEAGQSAVTTPLFNVDMLNSDEFVRMAEYNQIKNLALRSNAQVEELNKLLKVYIGKSEQEYAERT